MRNQHVLRISPAARAALDFAGGMVLIYCANMSASDEGALTPYLLRGVAVYLEFSVALYLIQILRGAGKGESAG